MHSWGLDFPILKHLVKFGVTISGFKRWSDHKRNQQTVLIYTHGMLWFYWKIMFHHKWLFVLSFSLQQCTLLSPLHESPLTNVRDEQSSPETLEESSVQLHKMHGQHFLCRIPPEYFPFSFFSMVSWNELLSHFLGAKHDSSELCKSIQDAKSSLPKKVQMLYIGTKQNMRSMFSSPW